MIWLNRIRPGVLEKDSYYQVITRRCVGDSMTDADNTRRVFFNWDGLWYNHERVRYTRRVVAPQIARPPTHAGARPLATLTQTPECTLLRNIASPRRGFSTRSVLYRRAVVERKADREKISIPADPSAVRRPSDRHFPANCINYRRRHRRRRRHYHYHRWLVLCNDD